MHASLTRNLAAFAECFRLGDAQVKRVRKSVRSVKSVGDKENTPCASFFSNKVLTPNPFYLTQNQQTTQKASRCALAAIRDVSIR